MRLRGILTAGLVALGLATAQSARAEILFGLTGTGSIISFDSAAPGVLLTNVAITGTTGPLIGIDTRPATAVIYTANSAGQIYTLNPFTGAAAPVAVSTVPPAGTAFGFDFNPVPDRLRTTSNSDQNLRTNVATGATIVDGTLAYAAGDANFGANPNIVGSAYTNSFRPSPRATPGTTLFNIDSGLDILTTQIPPNNGTLNTVGGLGVDTDGNVGFDLSGASGVAYASLTTGGVSSLYTIDLGTGAATLVGQIGPGGGLVLTGLTVQAVPEPASVTLVGVAVAGLAARRLRRKAA